MPRTIGQESGLETFASASNETMDGLFGVEEKAYRFLKSFKEAVGPFFFIPADI